MTTYTTASVSIDFDFPGHQIYGVKCYTNEHDLLRGAAIELGDLRLWRDEIGGYHAEITSGQGRGYGRDFFSHTGAIREAIRDFKRAQRHERNDQL